MKPMKAGFFFFWVWTLTSTAFAQSGKMRTYTSEDWDYWEISGDATATIRTYTSEDWDYWEFSGNLGGLSEAGKMAVLFIPVFTSSIYVQGHHQE